MSTNTEAHTSPQAAKQIHIFVNRRRLAIENPGVTGAKLLDLAGFEGTQWDLLQLHGEGDPTGGTLVLADQELTLKEGDWFRVVPGNPTFGVRR
jgi:hypothetical protein